MTSICKVLHGVLFELAGLSIFLIVRFRSVGLQTPLIGFFVVADGPGFLDEILRERRKSVLIYSTIDG